MSDSSEWHAKVPKELRNPGQARRLGRLLDQNIKAMQAAFGLVRELDGLRAENERINKKAIECEKIQAARYVELLAAVTKETVDLRDAIEKLIDIVMRSQRVEQPFCLTGEEADIVLKAHRLANPADPDFYPTEE